MAGINNLINSSATPVVGEGVTFLLWTDRKPGTVTEVVYYKSGAKKGQLRMVRVQEDHVVHLGYDPSLGYDEVMYERDTEAPVQEYRVTDRGWTDKFGGRLVTGHRDYYYDPHF